MPSSAVTAAVLNHVLLGGLPTARAQALHAALIDAAVPPWLPQAMDALAALGADADTAIAAILGASGVALPESERAALAELIEGQAAERQVLALHGQSVGGSNPEGLRRLLLAMTRDLRVVPILLATRLAELRSLADRRDDATLALARAVRDIHAPLANRLGVWQLKWELEDLAFRVLSPDDYRRVAGLVDERRREREHDINTAKKMLETALQSHGIVATISGRPKHIYSIWRKMERKSLPFEGLNDLRALRVMVDSVADCYAALGVAHALWPPVPGEFDDYIARPKHNDYRSLHTAVVGPAGKVFEIQFRTHEMHRSAELGVAAHWRYKEGGPSDSALERRVVWMRQLLDVQAQGGDAALAEEFDSELVEDRIYALTPRGEVVDLPTGSTPLDFAYRLHTELGHRCRGARVDGRIVPLDTPLATGQRVEIIAGKEAAPRRDWLLPGNRYLANARSRDKVRAWFRKLDRARNVQVGREMLERELKRYGRARSPLEPVLDRFQQVNSIDELYMRVALGEIGRPRCCGRSPTASAANRKRPNRPPFATLATLRPCRRIACASAAWKISSRRSRAAASRYRASRRSATSPAATRSACIAPIARRCCAWPNARRIALSMSSGDTTRRNAWRCWWRARIVHCWRATSSTWWRRPAARWTPWKCMHRNRACRHGCRCACATSTSWRNSPMPCWHCVACVRHGGRVPDAHPPDRRDQPARACGIAAAGGRRRRGDRVVARPRARPFRGSRMVAGRVARCHAGHAPARRHHQLRAA